MKRFCALIAGEIIFVDVKIEYLAYVGILLMKCRFDTYKIIKHLITLLGFIARFRIALWIIRNQEG